MIIITNKYAFFISTLIYCASFTQATDVCLHDPSVMPVLMTEKIDPTFKPVDFDASMKTSYAHYPEFAKNSPDWNILKNLYTDCMVNNLVISKKPSIPKIIHWIWLGSPLPEKAQLLQESWKRFHPDWTFKLWTDADAETFGLHNKVFYDKAVNWGQKSDIFRYEILYRYGGLYLDTDFECLRSFDVLHHTCDFYIGVGHAWYAFLYNGLIGSIPGHPILKEAIDSLTLFGDLTDSTDIQKSTGPHYITRCLLKIAPTTTLRTGVMPITYFYPFPNNERQHGNNPKIVASYFKPESFCVHYWACSWMKESDKLTA